MPDFSMLLFCNWSVYTSLFFFTCFSNCQKWNSGDNSI